MKKSIQFYAIKRGRRNGIFKDLEECLTHVKGFKDALYEKFNSRKKALQYLGIQDDSSHEIAKLEIAQTEYFSNKNDVVNAYVDGSFKNDVYSGAFIVVENNSLVYERSKKGVNNKAAKVMGSNVGELNATMLAIQYAINNGAKKILIYHDNFRIRHLIVEKKQPKNNFEKKYVEFVCKCKEEKELEIDFIKVKAHNQNKNKWNEYVDGLASKTREENYEVERDFKKIKEAIRTIKSNATRMDSYQKNILNEMEQKMSKLQYVTKVDENLFRNLYGYYTNIKTDESHDVKQEQEKITVISKSVKKRNDILHSSERSHVISYLLMETGLSINEIAEMRGLKETTIMIHLILSYQEGREIHLTNYLSNQSYYDVILDKLKKIKTNNIRVLKANLPDCISYEDIKIVMAVSGVSLSA